MPRHKTTRWTRLWPARLRLGRGRLAATRTRAGRRPSGCAVADTAAQRPQPGWPGCSGRSGRHRLGRSAWSKPSTRSQCSERQMQNINIFQGVKFKASQPKLGQASSGASSAAPLQPCAAPAAAGCTRRFAESAAAGAAATGSGRPSGCAAVAETAAATWPGRTGRTCRRTTATGSGNCSRGHACGRSPERCTLAGTSSRLTCRGGGGGQGRKDREGGGSNQGEERF